MAEALREPWIATPGARPHQKLVTTEGGSSKGRMIMATCEGDSRANNAIRIAASPSIRDAPVQMVDELEDRGTVGPDTLRQARAALARAESHEAEEA